MVPYVPAVHAEAISAEVRSGIMMLAACKTRLDEQASMHQ
jgi:hypothetical protein